jgi:hypothetical protein
MCCCFKYLRRLVFKGQNVTEGDVTDVNAAHVQANGAALQCTIHELLCDDVE